MSVRARGPGPSRNFDAPDGTSTHTYTFPRGVVEVRQRAARQPSGRLPARALRRARRRSWSPTRTRRASTTRSTSTSTTTTTSPTRSRSRSSSPASYRDMNGDGYTDLSGGLLYYISDGETRASRAARRRSASTRHAGRRASCSPGRATSTRASRATARSRPRTSSARASSTARRRRSSDLPGDGTLPGMVLGGAPDAKLDAVRRHLLLASTSRRSSATSSPTAHGVDVTSNSYGNSDVDNDGMDAASQEADIIHRRLRRHDDAGLLDRQRRAGLRHGDAAVARARASRSARRRSSAAPAGTRSRTLSQVVDNDVIEWSNRGPGANRRAPASTSSPTAPTRPATRP